MNVTHVLADFATGFDSIPRASIEAAKRSLFDLAGNAAAGESTDAARRARALVATLGRKGKATLWFSRRKLVASLATYANAAAASAHDLDDGHRIANGHPGAPIIPALLAAGQEVSSSSVDFLDAMVVAYETGLRVAAAVSPDRRATYASGRWAAVGVAAGVSRLMGLSPGKCAQALAIAATLGPDLAAAGYTLQRGHSLKEGIPWSSMAGSISAELAALGETAPLDVFDPEDRFDRRVLAADLGSSFLIETTYFKPYGCCRWIHPLVDGLLEILADGIGAEEVDEIVVGTFGRALLLNNAPAPQTLEEAQYSIPFCLAAAAFDGPDALLPLTGAALLRSDVRRLASHVRLEVDEDLDRAFPGITPGRVTVRAGDRAESRLVRFPLGDPEKPLSESRLRAKFDRLWNDSGRRMSAAEARRVLATAERQPIDQLAAVFSG